MPLPSPTALYQPLSSERAGAAVEGHCTNQFREAPVVELSKLGRVRQKCAGQDRPTPGTLLKSISFSFQVALAYLSVLARRLMALAKSLAGRGLTTEVVIPQLQ